MRRQVFPNPTVKEVIFQVRFPNLFFLQDKIGEFQIGIMKDFPESRMLIQRQFFIGQAVEKQQVQLGDKESGEPITKIWQFESGNGVRLDVAQDNLSLVSQRHKSYDLGKSDRFRDTIELVTTKFLAVTNVPILTRIGLRYIDECPVPAKDSNRYQAYYNTSFPLGRFPLEEAIALQFQAQVQCKECRMRYAESLSFEEAKPKLTMDFDAWAEHVEASRLLDVTDHLHTTISDEFFRTVRQPVIKHMKKPREAANVNR